MYFSFRSNSSHKVCLAVITGVVAGVLVLPGVCSRCISRCSGTSRCVTGVSAGVLVLPGACYRCISRCSGTYRCVTGVSAGVLVLTGVSGQRVVGGASAGRSKALGCLSSHPRPTSALRWLNLCAKLCPYHP